MATTTKIMDTFLEKQLLIDHEVWVRNICRPSGSFGKDNLPGHQLYDGLLSEL